MSEVNSSAFFGAVLKGIACTRNNGPDGEDYERGVIEPARRIRELEKEASGRELTSAEAERVLGWLETVLDTKRTPAEEREHHIRHVCEAGGLTVVARVSV
ncbi:hypothetical protein GCM10007079_23740 [Nocardiopsis terrae]|uniref:Uncharacterized protein n=1 Tax=Nocardiopsis terrae TaxID=372655 RepID=A0ABR9HG57_9ACTN|nr:hypothetical protein [Nocardiopsis terrae]MBE1458018.1 hypothetical protein [Nocardiopsis terrae]GHC82994.1 hypothetical protein GCM10007079_23740 [Nocardiopsis terrae]